jgi:hypothetical protein
MYLEPTKDGFQIDAADLAPLLGLAPQDLQRLMRNGEITSLYEQGRDEDAGRHRVTFRHCATHVCLTLNTQGEVLEQTGTQGLAS